MKIAFNPSTVAALTTPPDNKDITFDLRGQNIFARGVKFYGTDTNTWRDIKINNVSIGSNVLDLRNGSNTTLTNTDGIVTINSTWRPVVDNLTSDSTTSSLSANQGRILAGLINGKSDSDHNHDDRYVKKSGDTMLGALNFANGTWNLVGDDSYIGDCNISGHFGIKAANTTYPGITFFNNASTFLGNLTAYSGNIKYGAYSLQFLDNGNTSVNASTWTNPFSAYDNNAVADGQAICVWGQSSYLDNLAHDTGDMSLWLKRDNAKLATLNMVLDGDYYAHGYLRLAYVSEIPTSLKNPYALTISLNGTSQGPYDGSAAKNINITPGSIGAATSGHNHDGRYLRLSGQDTMQGNLYLHSYGTSYIGKGLGDKSGADFTEANIVIRSWWGISFKSYDDVVRTYIDTRTGNIGTKGVLNAVGAVIQGRVYNNGDDEGIIIKPYSNGCAGLILGTHNGERSVFYLLKGEPLWRYNNGSTSFDIYHPKKPGIIALTSDIPSKDSWNYDDRYLRLTGGWMSGDINFGGDNKIYWGRNTDSASISFKNDGDADADSYMSFVTSDNGNEYFRWSHSTENTNIEWMSLRGDGLRVRGTKVSLEGHTHDDRYYTKAESNAKYITDITTSVNKLTFTRNGANIARNITVNVVYSQGQLPNIPNEDATTKASPGLLIYDSYGQVIGTNDYSSVLSINTGGTIQIAGNWGDDHARNLYWRSQSDRNVADYPWKSWRTILDSENYSFTLDSRYYTESEVNSLLDAKLNRQNLSYGGWNPRGYNLAADYYYNGGDLSISENSGQIHVSIDGYFWQNEGRYRVLDTSDISDIRGGLTLHQYLSATDATWYPLVWGGGSHNNASDSTGGVHKSYDKLSWQTSSQTLYATNIQTNNIKYLTVGGGIYWNPYVETTTDNSDAASITLVRSGVAGGTTLVLSQQNDTNDTIQFQTNPAARLYHNSYPILTTQNTYVNNNKGYINGAEITQVNNADLLDGWHKDQINRTLYITSGTPGLSSYWAKLWEINLNNQYNDVTVTFLAAASYYPSYFSIFSVYLRQNGSGTSKYISARLVELIGNIAIGDTELRLYVNDTTGNCQLWGNVKDQYGTMNLSVLKKAWRTDVDSPNMGTFFSTDFSSVQPLPGDGWNKIGVTWQLSAGIFNPAAHTHTWTSITDKLVAGNEFNIVNSGFNGDMYFNYLPINDRNSTATISNYVFGNGHKGGASLMASGFLKIGSSDSYVLLGGGGHKTLSDFSLTSHTHTVFKNNLMIKGTNGISDSASIHLGIGDSDTGFKWISDGVCQMYANNVAIGQWTSGGMNWFTNPTVNGQKIWHAGNDGSGSGLDADTVDGVHMRWAHNTEDTWIPVLSYGHLDYILKSELVGQYNSASATNAYHLYINSANTWSTWYWAGQGGQPSWLWGSNDGTNMYLWDPNNFNVHTAQYLRSLGNQNCQTGRTQNYGGVYTYNTITGNTGSPTTYSSVIGFGRGIAGTVEIAGGWCNTNLYWRSLRDCCEDWYSWRTVLDSYNYTGFIDNYYWANVKISTSSSTTTSPIVSNLTATNSIKMSNISLEHTDEINNIANAGIHLNYRNSGNISLCRGGGRVGIGTTSPTQKLDVAGNIRATGQIIREGSSQIWANGRNGALLRETSASGYHTLWSLKTTDGSWDFGEYHINSDWNNIPVLSYVTDSNYNSGNNATTYQIKFPLASGTVALTSQLPSQGGDESHPIFLGYLNLDHGDDGTVSSSFSCLGYSVPFTYTRGGNYCRIIIPNTTHLSFYVKAATASVNYSGGGMDTWVGTHRSAGAWWLHCYAYGWQEVRVKGFRLANSNNDSWWGGNPLYSYYDGANRITVCLFGYVKFK